MPANPPRRAASTVEHARRLRAPPVPASDPWCTVCGGHLYPGHPGLGLVDVYAAVLPGLALRAHQHPDVVRRRLTAQRRVQLSSYGAPPRPAAVDAVAAALTEVAGARRE